MPRPAEFTVTARHGTKFGQNERACDRQYMTDGFRTPVAAQGGNNNKAGVKLLTLGALPTSEIVIWVVICDVDREIYKSEAFGSQCIGSGALKRELMWWTHKYT